jgi:apolipoprotein N-acyltransferase
MSRIRLPIDSSAGGRSPREWPIPPWLALARLRRMPQPIPDSARYYNSVVIVGDHARPAFHQRIPVPGGMWNPFQTQGGVVLNFLGPGTVDVGDQRAAILICYEQLLTWPMLRSAIEKPTLLIAISNEACTAATIVPRVQHTCVRAWARLFGLPVISAINS